MTEFSISSKKIFEIFIYRVFGTAYCLHMTLTDVHCIHCGNLAAPQKIRHLASLMTGWILLRLESLTSDLEDKLQTYNKINGEIQKNLGKQMKKETKLRIHNITAKAGLKFCSEIWVLKKREEQRLEATQMKFSRHLLGITKLDKEN